ncbi:prepilin-type N-terminal cleavage/methylation domain-containing protein [Viridibacillus sp. YIM B01967]|uniref:Prepilin-type N-terminal cleavage/methylation domain-containing protein n=1 Tax=Viridibacillus soli TaxID=2798301 RepID=A0ABS1H3X6_9BACL|nr:type II secretion system protein [Viridibacillus soli]MBK3494009.1 prepilin-type N-terminal cleavage/methylation domain-containing protein [Viridibacillus soli]
MNNKEAGFTFVELLIVLAITIVVCSLSIAVGKAKLDERMINQFLYQLMLDIEHTQSESIGNEVYSYLEFFDEGKKYRAYTMVGMGGVASQNNSAIPNLRHYYFTRELPEGVELSYSSTLQLIKINNKGVFSSFGTLAFATPTGKKSLIINIVKGRMKIVE